MLKKRLLLCILALLTLLSGTACNGRREGDTAEAQTVKIGILLYRVEDTFINELSTQLQVVAKEEEAKSGKKIFINIQSSQNNQNVQNDQVDRLIKQKYDVLCINMVDRTLAAPIIERGKKAGIPIIFFNREPVREDILSWNRCYYIGTDAISSGKLEGQIAVSLLKEKFKQIDRNNDNKIQYVMLEGEVEHQDSLLRTEHSISTVVAAGFRMEKLASESANWIATQAETKVGQWLDRIVEPIEMIFANNDEMAIGAYNAYAARGRADTRPVILGIDATERGLKAVQMGQIDGTVLNDSRAQAEAILRLALAEASGSVEASKHFEWLEGQYVRVPHRIVTLDNLGEIRNYLQGNPAK